ncbi:transposase [Phaeodactylibacter xiamenensis]|uniref:transposase n=1 Tax=Phaeodactylibacter xiamenensis TaxID=1524460 RepID=UPI0024A81C05|nr:transposase [Phaeodactylibacter xiamenensis]
MTGIARSGAKDKAHKYTLFKRREEVEHKAQKDKPDSLFKLYPTLGEAYWLKIPFDDFWEMKEEQQAEMFLADWCGQVGESNIFPFIEFTKTLKDHCYGINKFYYISVNQWDIRRH